MARTSQQNRQGILAAGNWIIDQVKIVNVYPDEENLAVISEEWRSNGGGPYNLLTDLALMRAPFVLAGVGLVGDDAKGEWILQDCEQRGIDTSRLRKTSAAPTSYTDVMTVQKTGRRTFFHMLGANALFDSGDIDFSGSEARIFYLGYLLLLERLDRPHCRFGTAAAEMLSRARQAGMKTTVDVVSEQGDRFRRVVSPALPHIDYCILNEYEAGQITGLKLRSKNGLSLKNLEKAARQLIEMGVQEWAVIHFPEGACACSKDGKFLLQGSVQMPPEKIIGAVGAGDAFAAGFLFGMHEGAPAAEALRIGVCAAACCLTHASSSAGMKPLRQCLQLGRKHGYRALQ